jgi:hypothetical protein
MSRPKSKFLEYLSPAGAAIVLICFFLPWLRVSCGAKRIILRGSSMGGIFWLVFVSAAIILVSYLYFKKRGKTEHARFFFLIGSVVALGIIIYKYIAVALNPDIPFYIPERMIGFELKLGALGTIIGLLMVLAGGILPGAKEGKSLKTDDEQ